MPDPSATKTALNWCVYIILCSDNTLYTGITNDLQKRYRQHASGRGAKYFLGRNPVRVVYQECGHNRSTASTRELRIKSLSRHEKHILISSEMNDFAHGITAKQV